MQGTFYICPKPQGGRPMLTSAEICAIAKSYEIGAHTLTHPRLTTQTPQKVREEMIGGKQWIEGITGTSCTIFCYPKGDWNPAVRQMAIETGYRGARTTEMLRFTVDDPYAMPTSLQVYPFPLRHVWTRLRHAWDPFPWHRRYGKTLRSMRLSLGAHTSWLSLAVSLFRHAMQTRQPVFHLWGHSAEIEKFGMWKDLEQFLHHVKESDTSPTYVPNSGLL